MVSTPLPSPFKRPLSLCLRLSPTLDRGLRCKQGPPELRGTQTHTNNSCVNSPWLKSVVFTSRSSVSSARSHSHKCFSMCGNPNSDLHPARWCGRRKIDGHRGTYHWRHVRFSQAFFSPCSPLIQQYHNKKHHYFFTNIHVYGRRSDWFYFIEIVFSKKTKTGLIFS